MPSFVIVIGALRDETPRCVPVTAKSKLAIQGALNRAKKWDPAFSNRNNSYFILYGHKFSREIMQSRKYKILTVREWMKIKEDPYPHTKWPTKDSFDYAWKWGNGTKKPV